jgi:hypothetical protein
VISRSRQRSAGGYQFLGGTLFAGKTKGTATRSVHELIVLSAVIFCVPCTRSLAIGEPGLTGRSRNQPQNAIAPNAETNRILWVLENKMEGQLLQEKAKNKLSKLNSEQIRLLDSLAVRIIKSDHTAASNIAFLLITALIISS